MAVVCCAQCFCKFSLEPRIISSSWFSFSFLLFLLFFFLFFFCAKLAAISTGVAKRENELKETIIQLKSDQLKISVQVTKILTMMLTY